jgi:hypothetical protein
MKGQIECDRQKAVGNKSMRPNALKPLQHLSVAQVTDRTSFEKIIECNFISSSSGIRQNNLVHFLKLHFDSRMKRAGA